MNEEKYNSVNGVIYKLDTFKGKKALVGDYSVASYYNTRMVLDSLGIEYEIVGTIEDVKNKVLQNNYDIIFTNNIYRSGDSQKLLEEVKSIKNFNTPIVIHTISDNINNCFLNMGFNGYLKKPIKQSETIELLKKIFNE